MVFLFRYGKCIDFLRLPTHPRAILFLFAIFYNKMPIPPYKNQAKTTSSTSQSSKPTGTILKKGSSGSQVKALQKRLIAAGFSLPKYGADGSYGNETVQAVKALQKKAGIAVDGIYGPATEKALAA
ncbi:peptidoglycan-binding protein, partial [Bacillus licheniformis]|nr:peptidoglycan-binding protein [Bacillus licheniformis]